MQRYLTRAACWCAAMTVVALSLTANAMAASSADSHIHFAPSPSTVGPNLGPPPLNQVVASYASRWHLSEATAKTQLEIQDRGVMMPIWQADALGGHFGGIWFDNAHGAFYVGIAPGGDRASAELVTAEMEMTGQVVYQNVRWSLAELESANEQVIAALEPLENNHEATVGIDVAANAVEVYLSTAATPASRELADEVSQTAPAKTLLIEKPPIAFSAHQLECPANWWDGVNGSYTTFCNKPLRSAAAMDDNTNGSACSIGALFGDSSGNVYTVTAGHCLFNNLGHWWSTVDVSTGERHNIGEAMKAVYGSNGDFGMIKMKEGSYWYSPYVAEANIPYQTATYELKHPVASYVGMYQCWSGAQSNTHQHMGCGTVQRLEVNDGLSSHMVESYGPGGGSEVPSHDLCLYDGDSGGPVITDHNLDGLISAGYSCGEGAYTAWYASAIRLAEYYKVVFVGSIN